MAATIADIVSAFGALYDALWDRNFRKTLDLKHLGERELLPMVRTFLLGRFGSVTPEYTTPLPGTKGGLGKIDFVVGKVAVEFAVRKKESGQPSLTLRTNETEVKKLMKYDGLSLLVLFDFSKNSYDSEYFEKIRDLPSLGQGNHKKFAFNLAYFHVSGGRRIETRCIRKNIRTR